MSREIRVLVADDSAVMRAALVDILKQDPAIRIVGQAVDGEDAVAQARLLRPDVVTMDVNMPRLDGLSAVAEIMAEVPCRVLMVCATSERDVDLSFRALRLGAIEVIPKPGPDHPMPMAEWGRRLAQSVRLMSEVPVVTRRRSAPVPAVPHTGGRVLAVGIAASTGGPPAIATILSALPPNLAAPVFVAQHLAEGFGNGLVRWMKDLTRLKLEVAVDGAEARPGHVYFAPDGRDLEVDGRGVLSVFRSTGKYSPSGDRLLSALAKSFGRRAAGVVLTGMGDDGAEGLLQIRRMGGVTLAQDEATSVVFGMPQAAYRNGAAERLLPVELLAPAIRDACGYLLPSGAWLSGAG